jgi:hypothetical protein
MSRDCTTGPYTLPTSFATPAASLSAAPPSATVSTYLLGATTDDQFWCDEADQAGGSRTVGDYITTIKCTPSDTNK